MWQRNLKRGQIPLCFEGLGEAEIEKQFLHPNRKQIGYNIYKCTEKTKT